MNEKENKQTKREARQLADQARLAMFQGDYLTAKKINTRIVELVPDTDLQRQALNELSGFRLDRWVIYFGLFALFLYGVAWLLTWD